MHIDRFPTAAGPLRRGGASSHENRGEIVKFHGAFTFLHGLQVVFDPDVGEVLNVDIDNLGLPNAMVCLRLEFDLVVVCIALVQSIITIDSGEYHTCMTTSAAQRRTALIDCLIIISTIATGSDRLLYLFPAVSTLSHDHTVLSPIPFLDVAGSNGAFTCGAEHGFSISTVSDCVMIEVSKFRELPDFAARSQKANPGVHSRACTIGRAEVEVFGRHSLGKEAGFCALTTSCLAIRSGGRYAGTPRNDTFACNVTVDYSG